MTEHMKEFLLALAELMEVHDIDEIDAVDDGADYYPSVSGVEFQMWSRWDAAGNETRERCSIRIGKEFTADDVRKLVSPNAEITGSALLRSPG